MKLSVVVPCYNEEDVLPETISQLVALLNNLAAQGEIGVDSEIVFVDDGSSDSTWEMISSAAEGQRGVRGIKLSRNQGHQTALIAGLWAAHGDAVITVDADLQDDLGAIEKMIAAHRAGADIVYGVRARRDTDTRFKRVSALAYYWLLHLLRVDVVFNHADYRLLSRRAVNALKLFGERNLFLRGIVRQLGFPSAFVYYDRAERFAGETKYPLGRMLSLAWQGVTSFSAAPLRAITASGLVISAGTFVVAGWALWTRLFTEGAVPGWASTVIPLYFLGGVQLLCIGIIGEYLAKIYMEVKGRPAFLVEAQVPIEHNQSKGEAGASSDLGRTR
jgi:polyisoprenyl-phosphate glycosyltransferase